MKQVVMYLLAAGSMSSVAFASPAGAENDAYEMAVRQTQAGFTIYPGSTGSMQANEKTRLLMPVTAGVTYTFLSGVDERVADVDLYVFDEQGNEILVDDRLDRRAGTKFLATNTGTAEVYVLMNATRVNRVTGKMHGMASWALLVGTRGGSTQERRSPVGPGQRDNNESPRNLEPKKAGDDI